MVVTSTSGTRHVARFVLDTGTQVTILDQRLAADLGMTKDRSEGPSNLIGPTGPDRGYRSRGTILVMGRKFPDRQLRCHHLWSKTGVEGLVGLDIIRLGALRLDLPWGVVGSSGADPRAVDEEGLDGRRQETGYVR
jgi:hypothetical protein